MASPAATVTNASAGTGSDINDRPDKTLVCSVARYAFEAYDPLTPPGPGGGTFVTGIAGRAKITFLDKTFVQQAFGHPGGGLLEITLSDTSTAFTNAELAVELRSFDAVTVSAGGGGSSTPAVIRKRPLGGAVTVTLPSTQPVHLGVRDKTGDVLHLGVYDSSNPSGARVVVIPLSDVPETDVPVVKVVPLPPPTATDPAAAAGGSAASAAAATTTTGHATAAEPASSVSFSWRLIPFSKCETQQFTGTMQLKQQPLKDAQDAELREVDALIDAFAKGKPFGDDDLKQAAMVAEMRHIAHEMHSKKRTQKKESPEVNWDALSSAAGAPNLQPLAVIECADKVLQMWMHRDLTDGKVVVAFRGTMKEYLQNWLTDLDITFVEPRDLNPAAQPVGIPAVVLKAAATAEAEAAAGAALNIVAVSGSAAAAAPGPGAADAAAKVDTKVLVHRGFLAAYMDMRDPIMSILNALLVFGGGKQVVVFTGHSLGGAMATMAAYDLAARQKDGFSGGDIQLITFGSPRVGNLAFMYQLNALLQHKSWRFTNTLDIVPKVPEFSFLQGTIDLVLYYHIGAHWDLEAPEADPKFREGLAADDGKHRPALLLDPVNVVIGIMAHLGPRYYAGLSGFYNLNAANGGSGRAVLKHD